MLLFEEFLQEVNLGAEIIADQLADALLIRSNNQPFASQSFTQLFRAGLGNLS
jgi:hypothetical protein